MATPHVAGAAAVLMALYPGKPAYPGGAPIDPGAPDDGSALTIKDLILSFADRKPQFEGKVASGGRLSLFNAINYQLSPVITSVSASQTFGYAPLTVTLSGDAEDPDGNVLAYFWMIPELEFLVNGKTANVTLDTPGTYEAYFMAFDNSHNETIAKVTITVAKDQDTVLIVNDDQGAPGDQMIASALEMAGLDYAILTPPLTGVPTDIPNVVIWNLGGAYDGTLKDEDITWLEAYLDSGGRLLMAGMDLIWDLGDHPFVRNYLHVAEYAEDVGISTAYGVPGEFTEGMEMDLDYWVFGGQDYSDIIVPDEYGRPIFTGDNGYPYATYAAKDNYRVIFLAFPVEAMPMMPMGGEVTAEATTAYLEDFIPAALGALTSEAPTAAFAYVENEPNTVQFTDLSTDPNGDIVSWEWDFGDGTASTEQNPVHEYASNGGYSVTLTVTDSTGYSSTVTKTVQLGNIPPDITLLSPVGGERWAGDHEIIWEAADPDGSAGKLSIKLEYSGDGGLSWKPIAEATENDGVYLWDTSQVDKGGAYIVRATATDPDGGVAFATSGELVIVRVEDMVIAAPNPASDHVTFYYDLNEDATLYVYDITGRLVFSADLAPGIQGDELNAYNWQLENNSGEPLANGLYLYLVITDSGEKSGVKRLVISR